MAELLQNVNIWRQTGMGWMVMGVRQGKDMEENRYVKL